MKHLWEEEKNALRPPDPQDTRAMLDWIDRLSDQFDHDAALRERFKNNFYAYMAHEMRKADGK